MTNSASASAYYEKSGTIDSVVWSAQTSPTRVIATLSFTDGEELSSIAVDDRLASSLTPGRDGSFAFSDAGGMGALILLRTRSGEVWGDRSVWQAAGTARLAWGALQFALALALFGIAMLTPLIWLFGAGALLAACGIRSAHVATCRLQTAALIGGEHTAELRADMNILEPLRVAVPLKP